MYSGFSADFPSHVLALSIIDGRTLKENSIDQGTKILVVVRRPETNDTHPNVISVPTQRIPRVLFTEIFKTAEKEMISNGTIFYNDTEIDNLIEKGHHPVLYAVESIFSRKLGVSEELEVKNLILKVMPWATMNGKSFYPDFPKGQKEEHISMANVRVVITKGADRFPSSTSSYSYIFWSDVGTFFELMQQKDPAILGASLDAIEHCVHGLCMWSTYNAFARKFGMEIHVPQDD